MTRPFHRPASLPGLLARYLLLTAALGILAAVLWWLGVSIFINSGLVLPAYSGERAALAATETLPPYTAKTFAEAPLDPLCRYVLFAAADSDEIIAANVSGRALQAALRCWHGEGSANPFAQTFSRRVTLADGSVCLLTYDFSMPYALPGLRWLPDFQLLGLLVLAAAELGLVVLTTRRTARRLRRESERLQAAADQIRAGALAGPPFPRGQIRELDAALQAMQTLREQLAESLEAQWTAEAARTEQIAALTHDLKTPLTVIAGNAELLAESELPAEAAGNAAAILRAADRAEDYLAALRAAAAAPNPNAEAFAPVDAAAFLAERAAVGRALAAPRKLAFTLENRLPAGCAFPAQAERLGRALDNMLDNAARFTPAGGQITLTAAQTEPGGAIAFTVRDTGPGFSPEALRKAGTLLFTSDAARGGHQGLGLTLARAVAAAHSGTLTLANTPQGASATITVAGQ